MIEITLLHISDLHISKYESREPIIPPRLASPGIFLKAREDKYFAATYTRKNLRALTRFTRKYRNIIDGIVVSGDIATTGEDLDLKRALTLFTGEEDLITPVPFANAEPTFNGIFEKKQILLIPGNHDRYKFFSINGFLGGYLPGYSRFDSVFSDYWNEQARQMILEKDNFIVCVFGADFNLRRRKDAEPHDALHWHAQGKVYTEVLDSLEERTRNFKSEYPHHEKLVVWTVHFPPVAEKKIKSHSELLNGKSLIEAAVNNDVSLILCGHLHQPSNVQVGPNTYVLAAGTATQYYAPEGNFCHHISFKSYEDRYEIQRACYKLNNQKTKRLEDEKTAKFIEHYEDKLIKIYK